MKRVLFGWISLVLVLVSVRAEVPAAEELLPADTLFVLSVPDWARASEFAGATPYRRLWSDPAMRRFRESFVRKFSEDVLAPFDKEFGFKFAEFAGLARGQVTLALTPGEWNGSPGSKPGWLLLLDVKDQEEKLGLALGGLKTRWSEAGMPVKLERIQDRDFTVLMIEREAWNKTWEKAFPGSSEGEADLDGETSKRADDGPKRFEVMVGQVGSLLIVGSHAKDITTVVRRLGGGSLPTLAANGAFESSRAAMFRDAIAFGWVNSRPIYDTLSRQAAEAAKPGRRELMVAPRMDKILAATGLGGLRNVALKLSGDGGGTTAEVVLKVPASARDGLFKLLTAEAKDASPPAFVPGDVVRFSRWRLDGQKAWTALETMLTSISPEMAGILELGMATVGKDKDPNFDLKRSLVGNLADDFISYEKRTPALPTDDQAYRPSITLVASPRPGELVQAFKAATVLLPVAPGIAAPSDREFLGRRIHTVSLPDALDSEGKPRKRQLSFAATAGHVAISTDVSLLEEFLRSAERMGRMLRDTPGLAEAAGRIGGMGTGYFGFEDHVEVMRGNFEKLRRDSLSLDKMLASGLSGAGLGAPDAKSLKGWFDFSLLPPFDAVAHYFHHVVYGMAAGGDGIHWKVHAPVPPMLPK